MLNIILLPLRALLRAVVASEIQWDGPPALAPAALPNQLVSFKECCSGKSGLASEGLGPLEDYMFPFESFPLTFVQAVCNLSQAAKST